MTMQRLNNLQILAMAMTLAVATLGVSGAHAQDFYTDIHDFDTPLLASPQYAGILAQGRDGNLYGTAPLGGTFGRGGVFMITPAGAYSVIRSFDGTMANPYSGLTLGTDGNFYGTTYNGGAFLFGTVFQITPGGTVTVLHSFKLLEGAGPYAPPIEGTDGNFYGTTTIGGGGFGAVYKVTPAGGFTTLYAFDKTHGASPFAPLIQAKDGNFYGTTVGGGMADFGTVFKITPAGTLTVLYNFDSTHGSGPYSPLLQASDGNFYGTARGGGSKNNGGVAFKLTAAKKPKLTVLYSFDATGATKDGVRPYAGLIQASDGNFYSVASAGGTNGAGTLYEITKTGSYSTLYNFVSATGSLPFATLIQHTNGKLYGEATSGGAAGHGALFSFDLGLGPFVTLRPTSGVVGQPVDILGQGLSQATSVRFTPNVPANANVFGDTYMTTTVPNNATSGVVKVLLTHGHLISNQKFLVTPVVLNFSPSGGPVGTQVVITGNSLTGATKVAFGSKKAIFSVDSYTQITATVPAGAVTGKIQVTTPGGTAVSPTAFTVN
jgi:uncharacterized repeat protein (TIGR03803 family)